MEVEGGPASSVTGFPFTDEDKAAAGLFILALNLSAPAPEEVTVIATLDMKATEVTAAFGGMPVPGTTVTFGTTLE
jgi:hypothetical protein